MKKPETKVLVVATKESFAKFLLSTDNVHDIHFIRYTSILSLIGFNLTDVIFLDVSLLTLQDLIGILSCLRAKGFNEKTRIRIKIAIDSLIHIEAKAKEAKVNVIKSLCHE